MNPVQCALVTPVFNEEECIRDVIEGWCGRLRERFGECFRVVVVDDGSTDGTPRILSALTRTEPGLLVHRQPNRGHGAALLAGYRAALDLGPDFVFQVDSDNQFEMEDFERLWAERDGGRLVLGVRVRRADPFHRRALTFLLRVFLRLAHGVSISDPNVPFRLFHAGYLAKALPVLPGRPFAPNIFLSLLAAKEPDGLVSVPVRHRPRATGRSSLAAWRLMRGSLRSLREILEYAP